MKRYLGFSVVLLCGALVVGVMPGCVAPESSRLTTVVQSGGARPLEVQPTPRGRVRAKTPNNASPIVVAKAAATPTASAKAKAKGTTRAKDIPVGTAVPFYFSIDSAACPAGVDSVSAIVKCYQITSLSNASIPSVGLNSTPLAVFPGSAQSKSLILTPGATTQVNLTFPSSTAGMEVIVIITGTGEDQYGDPFNFSGANISVVNP